MGDQELQAELARLRAENERLRAVELNPEHRAKLDSGLARVAQHAEREAGQYRQIQMNGLTANIGNPPDIAYDAAAVVLQDMGLA